MWIGRLGLAGGFGLGGLTVQQCGHDLFCVDAVGGFFPDELQQAAQFVIRAGAIAGEATQQCEHILEQGEAGVRGAEDALHFVRVAIVAPGIEPGREYALPVGASRPVGKYQQQIDVRRGRLAKPPVAELPNRTTLANTSRPLQAVDDFSQIVFQGRRSVHVCGNARPLTQTC